MRCITGRSLQVLLFSLGLVVFTCEGAWSQVNVWTHRYDNARSGANLAETQLNTSNVNSTQFGKLFSYAVDADIYTQPLVINSVSISGKGMHNVVYVATNNNSVYAFDADNNQGANGQPLWQVNLNGPGVTPIPASLVGSGDNIRTPGPIGIMGTPVIDQTTGTMYLVARTQESAGGTTSYVQRLHALDITSGAEKFGGPVVIQASVSGSGYDSVGGVVTFNALQENQRAGIALANGNVYIAWASYGDTDPYHGWVMAYSASTLQQVGVLCITPNGGRGGIWQSGQPLSVDTSGNLYVATGNGDFDGVENFGSTVLKLSPILSVIDWFTPDNWAFLNAADLDLSSAGVLLVPGSTDVIGAGKDGLFYVLNQNSLGHTQTGNGQIVQLFQASGGEIHGSPTYWNGPSGPWAYVWGAEDYLKAFAFNGSTLNTTPISESTYPAPTGLPGGFLTISANGSQAGSGILWASISYAEDADAEIVSGVLRAFDSTDLTQELWNTRMVPARDDLGNFAKFVPPTVANGRVYVPSFSNLLHVYGLLGSIPPATGGAITESGVASTSTVNLSVGTSDWADWPGYDGKASGNEQISDFTLLGSVASATAYNDPRTLSWDDGTVTVCNSTTGGVSVSGTSNGFLITVPADTTSRTLNLYVGGSNSRGMLTAQLSDGSAPNFVDTGFSSTGQYDVVYTLNYQAASAGQQLTVLWTLFSGGGNVTLQGAALIGASGQTPAGCGVWVEDALPLGATTGSDGDGWEWVNEYPTPYSGMLAHESAVASGEHQHYFYNATATLPVAAGDTLFTYVYLDPLNLPSEVMLQWYDGSWEHRAYWGADLIGWGSDGTVSRVYMGPLPAAGQWVELAVPAAQVGLGGTTVNGMAYTLYGGRATWDYSGKSSAGQLTPTTTTLASSLNPSTVGSSVTFTATVAGSSPTGSVNFTDGGSSIAGCGAVALPTGSASSKSATCSTASLVAGTHSIVASYSGDSANNGSTSATLSQVVNSSMTASTTSLASSANPSTVGASVIFTATVSGSAPTGSVGFTADGTTLSGCSAVALPTGSASSKSATCSTASLVAGTHSIVASYSGDSANNGSTSATLSQVVTGTNVVWVENSVPTGAVLGSDGGDSWDWVSSNPTPYMGTQAHQSAIASGEHQHYFYNATATLPVAAGDTLFTYVYLDPLNLPSEVMLQWYDGSWEHRAYWGADLIGWGSDGTVSRVYMGPLPAAGQWVELAVPAAQVGLGGTTVNGMAYTLYGGRATWDYSGKSSAGQLTPTTTTLASSLNPSTVGSSVTFTATVAGSSPTGSVNFTDGGSSIAGCGAVALPTGSASSKSATCSTASLVAGTHSIVASYSGDSANNGSTSATLSQVVNSSMTASTTSLASSANPSTVGASVIFTATVSGSAPTGSVGFTADGTTLSGCSAVALPTGSASSKSATCSTASLVAGTHSIVASYSGDSANNGSTSATLSQVVTGTNVVWVENSVPTGAVLGSDGGDSWDWVSSNPTPYMGTQAHQSAIASGEHQHYFYNATATLPVAAGDTLFTYVYLDPLNLPSEVMLQWYDGSWEHRAYWGADLIGWGSDGTVSRVYMGPLPAAGQWVELAVPAAQVGLGGTTVNGMAYTLYGGRATWDYSGKSSAGQLTPTTTTLASSLNPSTVGSSVTFTATVAGSSPTGSVNFTDGGSSIAGCGAVALPTGSASSKSATCSTASLVAGTHSIVASYSGDSANNGSTSATLSQVVNSSMTASTTSLASSANPSTVGASVIFTATVSGSAPTGSVGFTADGTTLSGCSAVALPTGSASSKSATCSTASLVAGTHSIVASYSGDSANNGSTSATLSQVVTGTNVVWVENSVPTGAVLGSDGGDSWDWVSSNPTPYMGTQAHQSAIASGEHQHYFYNATATLPVAAGDTLFTYVYLDPLNLPSEVMLQWYDGSWEHRAYWGADLIGWGSDGTVSRVYMGPLPAAGQWVELAVPAAQVGLGGTTLNGMAYTLYGGRATWDYSGNSSTAN